MDTIENMPRKETLSFRELPLISPGFIHPRKGVLREMINGSGGGGGNPKGLITLIEKVLQNKLYQC